MIPQCVRAPAYSAGLNLTERVAAWRRAQSPRPSGEADRDRAARRLRDWKSQPHFATGPSFARRLAAEGITEDELLAVLGGPIEGGDDPPSPRLRGRKNWNGRWPIPPPMARRSPSRRPCGSTRRPGSSSRPSRSWPGRAAPAHRDLGVGLGPGRPAVRPRHGRGDPARRSAGVVALDAGSDPGAGTPRGPPARPAAGRHARGAFPGLLATPPPAPGRPAPCSTNIPSWPAN